jgi:hypothetical protein
MSDLILHKTKGVNPHLTYCPRCHGEAEEILLLGSNDYIYKCRICNKKYIGIPKNRECQDKACRGYIEKIRVIEDNEKLPSQELCDKCIKEIKEHSDEVARGGVYWKCDKCNHSGVIKHNAEYAKLVRKTMKINPPDPCGIDFTDEADKICPICSETIQK